MPNPSRRAASCCRVAVVKGGRGRRLSVSRSTDRTASRASPDARRGVLRRPRRREPRLADLLPVEPDETRRERRAVRRRQLGMDRPVVPRREGLDLRLALADEAERHRLHPPGRAAARQLAPEQRREAVADQVVERAPRLPGPHQVHVDVARPRQGRAHRRRRHLVEGNAVHRHVADGVPFREPFQHLPGDRLALAVGIRRQHQGLGLRQRLRHRRERPGGTLAGLVDDREAVPGLHRARLRRQVADMAPGRDHPVVPAEIGADGPRLGGRFDDHHVPAAARRLACAAAPRCASIVSRHGPPPAADPGPFPAPRNGRRRLAAQTAK